MKLEILPKQMLISSTKQFILPFIFTLCFILQSAISFCSNDSATIQKTLIYDSSEIQVRQLNTEEQKKLLDNPNYKYDRVGPAPKSFWEKIKERFWCSIEKFFNTEEGKIGLSIFQYILIIAAIVVITLLILKNNLRAIFYGKSASVNIDFKEFEENIHKLNFEELIADAIMKNDYRKAVRLHFLKLLKELTDKNLISWKIDKTNNDYSIELTNSKYSKKFKNLALMYEYIWYGDFQLDETNFKKTILQFKEFKVQE